MKKTTIIITENGINKKVEQIEFSKEDKELLLKDIPTNPCAKCDLNKDGTCCGCPKGREYNKYMTETYGQGQTRIELLKYAKLLHSIQQHKVAIEQHKKQLQKLMEEVPTELEDLVK